MVACPCGPEEAPALGHLARHADEEGAKQREHVDDPPGGHAQVGHRQQDHRHPRAECRGHRQDAGGVGAAAGGHLLGGDHADQQRPGRWRRPEPRSGCRPARPGSARHRPPPMRQRRPRRTRAAASGGRADPRGSPAPATGARRPARRPAWRPAGRFEAPNSLGRVGHGLGDRGAQVARQHRQAAQHAEDRRRARVEAVRWRPPRRPPAPAGPRRGSRVVRCGAAGAPPAAGTAAPHRGMAIVPGDLLVHGRGSRPRRAGRRAPSGRTPRTGPSVQPKWKSWPRRVAGWRSSSSMSSRGTTSAPAGRPRPPRGR